jgi:hypothetical protein
MRTLRIGLHSLISAMANIGCKAVEATASSSLNLRS